MNIVKIEPGESVVMYDGKTITNEGENPVYMQGAWIRTISGESSIRIIE